MTIDGIKDVNIKFELSSVPVFGTEKIPTKPLDLYIFALTWTTNYIVAELNNCITACGFY